MHSQLSHGGAPLLMASDGAPGASHKPGKNFSVSIECDSLGEIERLFAAFSQNGHVTLPLGVWLAKTSYTRKMNDMATGSIRTVPIKCLS
jgi:uncharacterized glyoxalase superfamily protein PhnB